MERPRVHHAVGGPYIDALFDDAHGCGSIRAGSSCMTGDYMTHRRACVGAATLMAGVLTAAEARAQCPVVNAAAPPAITLATGASPEFYFRENGVQSLLLGRDRAGWDTDGSAATNTQHFVELFGY